MTQSTLNKTKILIPIKGTRNNSRGTTLVQLNDEPQLPSPLTVETGFT
ncbi:hypothetical protein HMPREF0322_00254 [Desulfitobacterium hafniense DP7]|uniref:Uncharacterized protein n=1 Tax=Desulfitobacterium hafniense DP7 TaxID=537010 RepID=G9XH31_DESHA|nr:hypothetical protein HMPREF0322_00254 [Desulfitobacterium hafniense DP7]